MLSEKILGPTDKEIWWAICGLEILQNHRRLRFKGQTWNQDNLPIDNCWQTADLAGAVVVAVVLWSSVQQKQHCCELQNHQDLSLIWSLGARPCLPFLWSFGNLNFSYHKQCQWDNRAIGRIRWEMFNSFQVWITRRNALCVWREGEYFTTSLNKY